MFRLKINETTVQFTGFQEQTRCVLELPVPYTSMLFQLVADFLWDNSKLFHTTHIFEQNI